MAFSVMFTIEDAKGANSTTEVNVPLSVAWTDITLFAASLAQIIDPLMKGKITRIGVCASLPLPGILKDSADPTADVEEGARFQFITAGGFPTAMRLPTFDEALIVAGTTEVDLTDGGVSTFVQAMESGIDTSGNGGSGVVAPSDKREDGISALRFAREAFQASRSRT